MPSFSTGSAAGYLYDHGDDRKVLDREDEMGPATSYLANTPEHPGFWLEGGADQDLGLSGYCTKEQMQSVYDELRDWRDGSSLGRRPMKDQNFQERLSARVDQYVAEHGAITPEEFEQLRFEVANSSRSAVHYVDYTYSLDKSWSAYYAALMALERYDDAELLRSCAVDGIRDSMAFLEDETGYTRAGQMAGRLPNGEGTGTWIRTGRYVVSVWPHDTSRAGDPQMHFHVAILNRVMCEDGKWRALATKDIQKARNAVEAVFQQQAERYAVERMGLNFVWREDGMGRSIAGVDQDVQDLFSSRRRAIEAKLAPKVAAYKAQTGHDPSPFLLKVWSQQITLETRPKKKHYDQDKIVQRWASQVEDTLQKTFADVLASVEKASNRKPREQKFDRAHVIEAALADVAEKHQTWTRNELIWALRTYTLHVQTDEGRELLEGLADEALASMNVVETTVPDLVPVPAELVRASDGRSVFQRHRPQRYATIDQLTDEAALANGTHDMGAPAFTMAQVDRWLEDLKLTPSQADGYREMFTSGRRDHALIGPPGAGKSKLVSVVAEKWQRVTGTTPIGLTVGQIGADVLRDEGLTLTSNIERFLTIHRVLAKPKGILPDPVRDKIDAKLAAKYGIRKNQLVIVDEASMIGTRDLRDVRRIVREAGGVLWVTGDSEQLTSVNQGGAFAHYIEAVGATELVDIMRYANDWEGKNSLDLRDGKLEALTVLDHQGRISSGEEDIVRAAIVEAYVSDLLDEKDPLMLAGSNEDAISLGSEAQRLLIDLGYVDDSKMVDLRNGTRAGVGDRLMLRKTTSRLEVRGVRQEGVSNRAPVLMTGITRDGHIKVKPILGRDDNGQQRYGQERELPPDYVAQYVELEYGSTVYAVQGRTSGTSHVLVKAGMDARTFLVSMTRARYGNFAHVVTSREDPNYRVILSGVVQRRRPDMSATQEMRQEWDVAHHMMMTNGSRLAQVQEMRGETRFDNHLVTKLSDAGRRAIGDDAKHTLYNHLRTAETRGHDPVDLLDEAIEQGGITDARSVPKVLDFRIKRILQKRPNVSRETDYVERSFADDLEPDDGSDFARYERELAEQMDRRRDYLGTRAVEKPGAHLARLGLVPDDPLSREEWRRRAGEVDAYRERYGIETDEAIGPRPTDMQPDKVAHWERAFVALGCPEDQAPMAEKSVGQLRSLVADYQRAEEWAPQHVGDKLAKARKAERAWHGKAVRDEARKATLGRRSPEAEQLRHEIAQARGAAKKAERLAEELERRDALRKEWYELTTERREKARLAAEELKARFPNERAEEAAAEAEAVANVPEPEPTRTQDARDHIARLRETLAEEQARRDQEAEQFRDEHFPSQDHTQDHDQDHGMDRD